MCCYSHGEPPFHHSFYKEQKPLHSQHVLGYELNCGQLVGWKSLVGSVDSFFGQNRLCPYVKFYPVSWEVSIAFDFLILFLPVVSMTNTAVISLERFYATFRPFRHRLINRWVYVVATAVVWVFPVIALVIGAIEMFLTIHHLYLVESHCCLCLFVTFVFYTSILFKFRFGAHPQRHCAAALSQRKLTVTLLIITLVSFLYYFLLTGQLKKIQIPFLARKEFVCFFH